MSIVDTELVERDAKTGRFVTGNFGGPGRKLGSRNKLGEAFIEDLRDAWIEHGAQRSLDARKKNRRSSARSSRA
jgi:hypothetical protein